MSTGLAHFAIGATLTTLIVTFVIPGVRYPRLVVVCGGVWAMLPDAWRVAPIYREELRAFHASPYADIFWFHYTLDRIEAHDSQFFALVMVLVFLAVTVVAERRDYRALAVIRDQTGVADTRPDDDGDSD